MTTMFTRPWRKSSIALPEPHPRFGYQNLTAFQRSWLLRRDGCAHGMAYAPGAKIRCLGCGRELS